MIELSKCFEGFIESRGVDLRKTLSIYNFSFWFDGAKAHLVLHLEDPIVVARVSVDGRVSLYSDDCKHQLVDRSYELLSFALGLNENLDEFYDLALRDPILRDFAREYRGWRLRSTSLWWALVIGVCQQNASFRQGWKMLYNIVINSNRVVSVESCRVPLPPTPKQVIDSPDILTRARVGYRSETILRIARAILSGELSEEKLRGLEPQRIEQELRKVKGVGSYTARLAMALSFRVYDLPPIDRWIKALAAKAYGCSENEAERVWVERWGRWSALAVIATTIALDAEPLRKALDRLISGRLLPEESGKPTPATMWRYSSL